ncbi:MAG: hypothetical protein H7144_03140 [Burkholderiales bacterium]|nr:hypothetical protein [Phycisphaerae bacterium]
MMISTARTLMLFTIITLSTLMISFPARGADPQALFTGPPDAAKPRVLWMWMGSNISRDGITSDLESLREAGYGGTMVFSLADVCVPWAATIHKSPTPEIIAFTPPWWALVKHAAEESKRLGMDFGIHNCAGYESSGGTWITPELSMQELAWSQTPVTGPTKYSGELPKPKVDPRSHQPYPLVNPANDKIEMPLAEARTTYFRDIAVLAVPAKGVITKDQVLDLSASMKENGALEWDAPAGEWIIYRFGHTTNGKYTQPAQWEAKGLECDKYSAEAVSFHINHVIKELKANLGDLVGNGLSYLHFDSYEARDTNWTPLMREEFKTRRGYELTPWLPTFAKRVIGSEEETKRFNDDFKKTTSDLYRDVYFKTLKTLINAAGLEMASEPYGGSWDVAEIIPQLDRVFGEFWTNKGDFFPFMLEETMVAARKAQRNIIEAEAFTGAPPASKWTETPAWLKRIGDKAFANGINRFVLHYFAHQPWADRVKPGMTMGQWGTHFSQNQTWWEPGKAWVVYVARCQALLQWGTIAPENGRDVDVDETSGGVVKAIHRQESGTDIYFVANTGWNDITTDFTFKGIKGRLPELWDPVRGTTRDLPAYTEHANGTSLQITFAPTQSFFVVFRKPSSATASDKRNFPSLQTVMNLTGSWQVTFDPKWGGPQQPVTFDGLSDWTRRSETGIMYYSGTASYQQRFDVPAESVQRAVEIDLGTVNHIARVKLNGSDLGVIWTAPWRAAVPAGLLKPTGNELVIEVTNVWANRLIGDEQEPADMQWLAGPFGHGGYLKEFPEWFLNKQPRPSTGRYTFATWNYFNKHSPLVSSGLLGPVTIVAETEK